MHPKIMEEQTPSRVGNCSIDELIQADFNKRTEGLTSQMLQVNGLIVVNAILAGILVIIGTYGSRYKHRAFIGSLFLGATTLFLPILSYVASKASSTGSNYGYSRRTSTTLMHHNATETQSSLCYASDHLFLVLIWACLVNIVGINTCTTVAASDREGRNIGIPMGLLVQAIWTSYLGISLRPYYVDADDDLGSMYLAIALIFGKMALRYYGHQMARHSVALGRNPSLIVGYIERLQEMSKDGLPSVAEHHCPPPPPLIVMGEDRSKVEKGAHGLIFKWMLDTTEMRSNCGLVTVDKVWLLDDNRLLTSEPWLREVSLSFALFKLLRCRYAGYTVAEAGILEAREFFLHALLKDKDHERVHDLVRDELCFLHDYYNSSIPIHCSNFWLPIANVVTSLLTISYCLLISEMMISYMIDDIFEGQVACRLVCDIEGIGNGEFELSYFERSYGSLVFDQVPVMVLLALVVLAEAREIASYVCSNWTKVALICRYVVPNQGNYWNELSPRMRKWIVRVLRCRCKLMKHWDDKMNQCSVLVLHPRRSGPVIALPMRLLHLPDRKKNTNVPGVVKAAIVNTLRSSYELLTTNRATFLRRSLEGRSHESLWDCESEGVSDVILKWHIATSILGVRRQHQTLSEDMIVSAHISRYCAYLVAYAPELLPDDDEWCKSLYKDVKKDSMSALAGGVAGSTAEDEYNKLISLLQERAKHKVLTNGVELCKKLVQLQEGEAAAWRLLAEFWSGMILYIAPSDNLNAHADAIARGGELITFVWALLMHVGIDGKLTTPVVTSTAAAPGV